MLSEIEKRRYNCQLLSADIGLDKQLLIKKSKILVIGAGGAGSAAIQSIAAAGVGTIGICDNAYVEEKHFCRQPFYHTGDLGKLKTIVAKEKIKKLNPFTNCQIHNIKMVKENFSLIVSDYNIILDCSNSNEICNLLISNYATLDKGLVICLLENFKFKLVVLNNLKNCNYESLNREIENFPVQKGAWFAGFSGMVGCMAANEVLKMIISANMNHNCKILSFDIDKYVFGANFY